MAGPKIALWKLQIAKARPAGDLEEATFWRRQVDAWEQEDDMPLLDAIVARAEEIEKKKKGYTAAKLFADTAFGHKTLLEPLAEQWLAESNYGVRATYDHRLRLSVLYTHHKVLELARWHG